MRALVTVFVLASTLTLAGCGGDKSGGSSGPEFACDKVQPEGFPTTSVGLNEGQTLPDQAFVDTKGYERCTRDFTGSVVFISIGTGWCPPCRAETPGFVEVYKELREEDGEDFELIQVMYEDYDGGNPDDAFMTEWEEEYGINFLLVADPQAEFFQNLVPPPADAIPHNILVDRDGVVRYTEAGSMPEITLRFNVRQWLQEDPSLDYAGTAQ